MRAEARRSWHPAFARWGGEKSEADAAKAADGDSEDQGKLVQKLLDIMKQTLDAKGLQQEFDHLLSKMLSLVQSISV